MFKYVHYHCHHFQYPSSLNLGNNSQVSYGRLCGGNMTLVFCITKKKNKKELEDLLMIIKIFYPVHETEPLLGCISLTYIIVPISLKLRSVIRKFKGQKLFDETIFAPSFSSANLSFNI